MTTREQNYTSRDIVWRHNVTSFTWLTSSPGPGTWVRDAMAADLALEGPDYLEPLEAEVRGLKYHQRELETPPLDLHHLNLEYDIDERLLSTTVPDPIRIRGVGGTTM